MGLFGGNAASPSFPGQCGASVGPPARRPAQGLGGQHGAWPVGGSPVRQTRKWPPRVRVPRERRLGYGLRGAERGVAPWALAVACGTRADGARRVGGAAVQTLRARPAPLRVCRFSLSPKSVQGKGSQSSSSGCESRRSASFGFGPHGA